MPQFILNNRLAQFNLWNTSNANREVDAKAWWLAFRNAIRTLLSGDADFKVGDIFRWQGAAGKYGHGFIIRMVGHGEWLIMGSADGNDSSSSGSYFSSIFQNTSATYFLRDGNTPTSITSYYSGLMLAYNPDHTVSFNTGYDADLELSGGDWTAPTSNPYTALASFWTASKAPMGIAFVDNSFAYQHIQAFHILIDKDIRIMRWDMLAANNTSNSPSRSSTTKQLYIGGDGFELFANNSEGGLADVGDTNPALNAHIAWSSGDISLVATQNLFGREIINRFYVRSLDGTTRLTDTVLSPIKDMTASNYKALSGNPKVRAVEVRSASVLKGTLKKKLCLEAYPYRDGLLANQVIEYPSGSGNKLIHEHESCCFLWIDGKSQWPYQMATGELPY